MSHGPYTVESRGRSCVWRSDELGGDPVFATAAAAVKAVRALRTLGAEWSTAKYRVKNCHGAVIFGPGLCITCGRATCATHALCADCRKARRMRADARRASGLCPKCGRASAVSIVCTECRAQHNARRVRS